VPGLRVLAWPRSLYGGDDPLILAPTVGFFDMAPVQCMPLNALNTASPDYRVCLDAMASLLTRLVTEKVRGPP
jgi:hypothetical protein